VAQEGALFPHLSIAENIGFGSERTDPTRRVRITETDGPRRPARYHARTAARIELSGRPAAARGGWPGRWPASRN